jgi:cytochrome c oxidase cbb3-type subunit 1
VHSGALGWNALITFGTFYYLVPKLAARPLHSVALANAHFWLSLAGVLLYILSMWGAGISQSLLWLTLDELGEVQYSFVEVMRAMAPYYLLRLIGGVLFLVGAVLMTVNLAKTFAGVRTATARVPAFATAGAAGS